MEAEGSDVLRGDHPLWGLGWWTRSWMGLEELMGDSLWFEACKGGTDGSKVLYRGGYRQ
ncbi:protein of unknown function [Kyrpidia spormannii]|uniref:Uncharacterized protein n=1 Tax=Kyrpidia spormannii TaxID=2055160 RepID=A0A6F9E5L3_9BACL|nr:protein of unknown function [Kyrpidia spormannii]